MQRLLQKVYRQENELPLCLWHLSEDTLATVQTLHGLTVVRSRLSSGLEGACDPYGYTLRVSVEEVRGDGLLSSPMG